MGPFLHHPNMYVERRCSLGGKESHDTFLDIIIILLAKPLYINNVEYSINDWLFIEKNLLKEMVR